ncbi:YCF48-related protein [uncultured Paludibaculum sp.]|uniref:YCF48-related protein n=1 Tax=uncultured Paludibaculum sp. TaxID=1765020 RepID=UPI002AAB1880|nr:YCF48-related protein [uncultured Paludibaculum sp.]
MSNGTASRRAFLAGACGLGVAAGQPPAPQPGAPKPEPPKPQQKLTPDKAADSKYAAQIVEVPQGPIARADAATQPYGGLTWKIQYQFDEDETVAALNDLRFASKDRGIAVGGMVRKGHNENFALLTRDGGLHWTQVKMKDFPYSLSLLDESRFFCLCEDSLWYSDEGGVTWQKRKLPKRKKGSRMARVHFLNDKHGYVFGEGLSVFKTLDGGLTWEPLAAAEALKLKPENTEWAWMNWASPTTGLIVGTSAAPPPEGSRLPDWMMPERALRRRVIPGSTMVLETRDGGVTWKSSMVSSFGHVVRMRGTNDALTIFHYGESMEFSSEVYLVQLRNGSNKPYFRRKHEFAYDAVPLDNGGGLVAAIERPGQMSTSPVPGRLRMYLNTGSSWKEMKVDYRASGVRATLARVDDQNIWVATDEGVILKLS